MNESLTRQVLYKATSVFSEAVIINSISDKKICSEGVVLIETNKLLNSSLGNLYKQPKNIYYWAIYDGKSLNEYCNYNLFFSERFWIPVKVEEFVNKIKLYKHLSQYKDLKKKYSDRIKINKFSRVIEIDSNLVILTEIEFNLIELLLLNNGNVVSKYEIFDQIRGKYGYLNNQSLHVAIYRLKDKLKNIKSLNIENEYGNGYKLSIYDKYIGYGQRRIF